MAGLVLGRRDGDVTGMMGIGGARRGSMGWWMSSGGAGGTQPEAQAGIQGRAGQQFCRPKRAGA